MDTVLDPISCLSMDFESKVRDNYYYFMKRFIVVHGDDVFGVEDYD
jgi:hypothetical protein